MRVSSLQMRLVLVTVFLVACILTIFYAAGHYIVVHTVRGAEDEVSQILWMFSAPSRGSCWR